MKAEGPAETSRPSETVDSEDEIPLAKAEGDSDEDDRKNESGERAKRRKTGARAEGSRTTGEDEDEDEDFEDDEPYAKRMKADWKVSCVSWADEGDREDEYKGLERDYRKCMYCNESFGSRNALYKHVNAAHKKPPNSRRPLQTIRRGPTGSVADRLAHTEETAGATSRTQDPLRGAHVETQVRREQRKEEYDLCEVFSVPRIAPEATKMQLRGDGR